MCAGWSRSRPDDDQFLLLGTSATAEAMHPSPKATSTKRARGRSVPCSTRQPFSIPSGTAPLCLAPSAPAHAQVVGMQARATCAAAVDPEALREALDIALVRARSSSGRVSGALAALLASCSPASPDGAEGGPCTGARGEREDRGAAVGRRTGGAAACGAGDESDEGRHRGATLHAGLARFASRRSSSSRSSSRSGSRSRSREREPREARELPTCGVPAAATAEQCGGEAFGQDPAPPVAMTTAEARAAAAAASPRARSFGGAPH